MRLRRAVLLATMAASLAVRSTMAVAQQPDLTVVPKVTTKYVPKKTAWGEPDLRGTWPLDHLNGRTPLERDPKYGNRVFLTDQEFAERQKQVEQLGERYNNEDKQGKIGIGHWAETGEATRRTSHIIAPANGRLPPMTDEGKVRKAAMRSTWRRGQTFDWTNDFDSWDACITRGLPASMFPFMYNNGIRIFQAPGMVAMQLEMVHETRMIPTDGRAALPVQIHNWMGESRGHWEGNVLVVETTNFKPGPSATNIGTTGSPPEDDTPVSEQARMVERFTMTGHDTIVYEFTWTDPVVFTAPWSARLEWMRNDKYGIFEYACHEGDVQVRNYISSSRAQRAAEKEKAQ
jgi:hypothetical protein